MGNRLQGARAVITGGASGFGAGIAEAFCAEGARVLIVDRNEEAGAAMAARLGATFFAADISSAAAVEKLRLAAQARLSGIDIVVNNAGIAQRPTPLDDVAEADFDAIFAVNAKSVYLTARAFVPEMKLRRSGVILNIASTGAQSPRANLAWYNASKSWMVGATRAMAIELAPFGVRVNAINPVAGETPLLASFMGEDTPEIRARFLASIPLGRFSTPNDIAAAAVFLCSQEAAMITGVALPVDGGRTI